MPTLNELREQRVALTVQGREILKKAETEKRELASDESAQFDKIMSEVDNLAGQIEQVEKSEERSRRIADAEAALKTSNGRRSQSAAVTPPAPSKGGKKARKDAKRKKALSKAQLRSSQDDYRDAFEAHLRGGYRSLTSEHWKAIDEVRNLQADADTTGGFLIPPLQFINRLIRFVNDNVYIRQLSTVIPVMNAQSMGAPSLDSDPNDADWTPELLTGQEDTAMAFGRRDLSPYPLAKRIRISNKLLRLATGVENLVLERLAYKFAITEEKAFLQGTGAQQPLGVFTADARGIDTSRDVSTGNTTTALTADGLIEAKYALKQQYQNDPSVCWIFARPTVKMIRKLKDANGQYLWQPGLGGAPDTLLDKRLYMSEYAPSTYTTGQYVGIIGAFRFYWIADSLNMAVQRLDELYAETNQVGFIARRELDAMPVLAQAFIRVKLA